MEQPEPTQYWAREEEVDPKDDLEKMLLESPSLMTTLGFTEVWGSRCRRRKVPPHCGERLESAFSHLQLLLPQNTLPQEAEP